LELIERDTVGPGGFVLGDNGVTATVHDHTCSFKKVGELRKGITKRGGAVQK